MSRRRGTDNPADRLARDLLARMEAADSAERLNDEVLIPFMAALEKVCGARGYVLNLYGETANVVFTGEPDDAEAIYQLVEAYLDDKADYQAAEEFTICRFRSTRRQRNE